MSGIVSSTFFSPTHTSRTIARTLAAELAQRLGKAVEETDWTLPAGRGHARALGPDDVLVLSFPVYSGRMPELLEASMAGLTGQGTPAVVAAVYGNRAYEDALLEARDMLTANGFVVTAGGAFIGEHSFSRKVAAGRPDAGDLALARELAQRAADKIATGSPAGVAISGDRPYRDRWPGLVVKPKTTDDCTECMTCAEGCPAGIISFDNPREAGDGCLRCMACVKHCPAGAKYFDDEKLLGFATLLETKFMDRKEPELFV